jgi:hypothetical protein
VRRFAGLTTKIDGDDRLALAAAGRIRREAYLHVRSAAGRFLMRPATSSPGTTAHASSAI